MNVHYPYNDSHGCLGIKKIGFFTILANSWLKCPKKAEPGKEGQERNIRLELKLIADAGLVGMPTDGSEPAENHKTIRSELNKHSKALAAKPEITIANKTDLDPDGNIIEDPRKKLSKEIHPISAVTGSGIKESSVFLW